MRFVLIPFLLFLISNTAWSQNSLLWEISGNGLPRVSYLYGTIHIQDKRVFDFSDSVLICLDTCAVFAGEVVLDKAYAKEMLPMIMLPKGERLKGLIGKPRYKAIKKHLKKSDLGLVTLVLNKLKPFYVMVMLSEHNLPKDRSQVLDDYLQQKARKDNKKVIGLETVKEQLGSIDKIPLDKQADMLKSTIDSMVRYPVNNKVDSTFEEMLSVYLAQDIEGLQKFTEEEEMGMEEFVDFVLLNRNHIMAERITTQAMEESVFAAIGAAHLGGKEGIIALLREKGYTVRAMNAPFKSTK